MTPGSVALLHSFETRALDKEEATLRFRRSEVKEQNKKNAKKRKKEIESAVSLPWKQCNQYRPVQRPLGSSARGSSTGANQMNLSRALSFLVPPHYRSNGNVPAESRSRIAPRLLLSGRHATCGQSPTDPLPIHRCPDQPGHPHH